MERLTESNPNWINDELWESAREPSCEEIDEVYRRLKHYEDLEEQGRLRTGGWIPVTERLPDVPEPNPIFDDKPLELYWVSEGNSDYAFRAFWNGQYFTDGFSRADVIAWQPLPEPYKEQSNEA